MGLAASQARLLTITARKADCEFQSMKLSHEKIALSRDMERISDEYQNAMNMTKLVYDYYGSGTSDMALSYGLLMTPSIYNDYYPKLITNNINRVVLSQDYAYAAAAAGIPVEGYNGTPSSEVRNRFIEALRDRGIISASAASDIESVPYNNGIGLGSGIAATAATQDVTYAELKKLLTAKCIGTDEYALTLGGKQATPGLDSYKYEKQDDNGISSMYVNNTRLGDRLESAFHLTLTDLLERNPDNSYKNNYVVSYEAGQGSTSPLAAAAYAQQQLVGSENSPSFLNWLVDQFSEVLGGVTENEIALQYAYNQVYDLIFPNEKVQEGYKELINTTGYNELGNEDRSDETKHNRFQSNERLDTIGIRVENCYDDNTRDEVAAEANNYVGFVYSSCYNDVKTGWRQFWGGDPDLDQPSIAINLNTVTDIFMTALVEYLSGMDGAFVYNKGKKSDAVLWNPDDNYIFKILAPTEVDDDSDNLYANFYDAMFNKICSNGWTENDNINDVSYMQELLKNGSVFISTINNDYNYYQGSYSTDTYIAEVADTEGIAKAEAKYNAAKSRIEHKENTIDMKMKNLDTEISSLTTEYDTMKGLISKVIEKSFKRYDA